MSRPARHAVIVLVLFWSGAAQAQFEADGPNAVLTLQGLAPDVVDPVRHDVVAAVPGVVSLAVSSGQNPQQGLILLSSLLDPNGSVTNATPLGNLNIGSAGFDNLGIVGDGIGLTVNPAVDVFYRTGPGTPGTPATFATTLTAPPVLAGHRAAFQAVVQDPTTGPFGLDLTQAGDLGLLLGVDLLLPLSDDGVMTAPFVFGRAFPFHGALYSQVHVTSNGYVTFGQPTSLPGFGVDPVGWLAAEPSIAVAWADWDPTTAGGVVFRQLADGAVIDWGGPQIAGNGISHAGDQDLNRFRLGLDLLDTAAGASALTAGRFTCVIAALDAGAVVQPGDGVIGHTPGTLAIGAGGLGLVSAALVARPLHACSVAPPGMPQFEEHDATGTLVSRLGFDGMGTPHDFNDLRVWDDNAIEFTPLVPGNTTSGYKAVVAKVPEPSCVKMSSVSNVVGQEVIIAGSFLRTSATPVVSVTGIPANNIRVFNDPAITGVSLVGCVERGDAGTPGYGSVTHGQALSFEVPPGVPAGPGTVSLAVTWYDGPLTPFGGLGGSPTVGGGSTSLFQDLKEVTITNPGHRRTSYQLGDDAAIFHALLVPVTFGGVTYTRFFIGSNGLVTFGAPAPSGSESLVSFFSGFGAAVGPGAPSNPGVAVAWTDLNPGGVTSGARYLVDEFTTPGTVAVTFENQIHASTGSPAGTFSVTFGAAGANSVTLDYAGFVPAGGGTLDDVVIGVTDGTPFAGTNTDLSNGLGTGIASVLGTYTSQSPADSIGERFPGGAPLLFATPVTFADSSGSFLWSIF